MSNFIPAVNSGGRFIALDKFTTVVDPETYYKVEAIRSIPEMEALKLDVYKLVFEPAGFTREEYLEEAIIAKEKGAVVITLVNRKGYHTYVMSNFLESFPLVGGMEYEHMCLVVDLGPCPVTLKPILDETIEHFTDYLSAYVGIESTTRLGVIPTTAYVSKEQYEAYEAHRNNRKVNSKSNLARIRELEDQLIKKDAYILKLESIINP